MDAQVGGMSTDVGCGEAVISLGVSKKNMPRGRRGMLKAGLSIGAGGESVLAASSKTREKGWRPLHKSMGLKQDRGAIVSLL